MTLTSLKLFSQILTVSTHPLLLICRKSQCWNEDYPGAPHHWRCENQLIKHSKSRDKHFFKCRFPSLLRMTAVSPLPVQQQRCPEQDSPGISQPLPALMQSPPLGKGGAVIWISGATKWPHGKMKFGDLNPISPEFACDLTPRAVTELDTYKMRSQRTHCVLHTDTLSQHFACAWACSSA